MIISEGLNYSGLKASSDEASKMYESIRKRKTDWYNVSNNTNFSIEQTQTVKSYIFNESHLLQGFGCRKFFPDIAIAQSWLRLSEKSGKNIQSHDILLLYHELYEISLLLADNTLTQYKAHEIATLKYDYSGACDIFYGRKV